MSKMRDRNSCQGDGCRTYAVNTVRHTPKAQVANGKPAKTSLKAALQMRKLTWEKVMLSEDGAITIPEFSRIVTEIVEAGKRDGTYDEHHEEVRQRLVGIVNDAFGYGAADKAGTDDPAENLDAMQASDDDDDSSDSDSALDAILAAKDGE